MMYIDEATIITEDGKQISAKPAEESVNDCDRQTIYQETFYG